MNAQSHPIIPPPELVGEWLCDDGYPWDPSENATITITTNRLKNVATQAARWGADQELEACINEIYKGVGLRHVDYSSNRESLCSDLRAARRPKPLSLKEQALKILDEEPESDDMKELIVFDTAQVEIIRRALESLPS